MPNLPAPYVSPWRELGRILRAVPADLRLRVQTLWRRNREGDLPRPAAWPEDLAPLFWPLLLLVSVLLFTALTVLVVQGSAMSRQRPPAHPNVLSARRPIMKHWPDTGGSPATVFGMVSLRLDGAGVSGE